MDAFQASRSNLRRRSPGAPIIKRANTIGPSASRASHSLTSPRSQPPPLRQAIQPSPATLQQRPVAVFPRSVSLQQMPIPRPVTAGRPSAPGPLSPDLGSRGLNSPGVAWPGQQSSDLLAVELRSLSPVDVAAGPCVSSAALYSLVTPTTSSIVTPPGSIKQNFGHLADIDSMTKIDTSVPRSEQDLPWLDKRLRAELGQVVAEATRPVDELCRRQAKEIEDLRVEHRSFVSREAGMQEALKTCLGSCSAAREIAGSVSVSVLRIQALEDLCNGHSKNIEDIQRQQAAVLNRDSVATTVNQEAYERLQQLQQAAEFRLAQDLRQDTAQACEAGLQRLKLDLTELKADLIRRCGDRELGDNGVDRERRKGPGGDVLLAVQAAAACTRVQLDEVSEELRSRLHKVEREMLIERAARAPPRLPAGGLKASGGFDHGGDNDFNRQLCARLESAAVLRACLEEEVTVLKTTTVPEGNGASLEALEERLQQEEAARKVLERMVQDAEA